MQHVKENELFEYEGQWAEIENMGRESFDGLAEPVTVAPLPPTRNMELGSSSGQTEFNGKVASPGTSSMVLAFSATRAILRLSMLRRTSLAKSSKTTPPKHEQVCPSRRTFP